MDTNDIIVKTTVYDKNGNVLKVYEGYVSPSDVKNKEPWRYLMPVTFVTVRVEMMQRQTIDIND